MENLEERVRALEVQLARWKGAFALASVAILAWVGVTAWVSLPREVNKQLNDKIGSVTMERVEQFNKDADAALQRLKEEGTYLRYGNKLALECDKHPGYRLHAGSGRAVTVERKEANSPFMTWTIQPVAKK